MNDSHGANPRDPSVKHQTAATRRNLLAWYDHHHRDLPWRRTRDPYRIWVSEIMLQQTRVQAVIPYYEKFLRRFPDVRSLAAADEQALLACWSGLGYYSRVRNLQKAARTIVSRHHGEFPRERDDVLALAGIGDYTAAAVLSIAYDVPLAVLDGNVARVLSRLFAMAADVRTNSGKERLLKQAGKLLSPRRPGDFNQAMMELGATVCLPQQPRCGECPLRKDCRAFQTDQVGKFPPSRRAEQPTERRFRAALILDGKGNCLLARRAASEKWMVGFWELPSEEILGDHDVLKVGAATEHRSQASGARSQKKNGEARIATEAQRHREILGKKKRNYELGSENSGEFSKNGIVLGSGILLGSLVGHLRHTITSNKLDIAVYRAELNRPLRRATERWVGLAEIERLPVTTITRKALRIARLEGFE